MNNLEDTVQLTAWIYKNLLPLINLDDYEEFIMQLTATLLDSNMIGPKEYEPYLSKFVIESKQLLKKQMIQEKTKAIEKAQETDEDKNSYNRYNDSDKDFGNSKLSLYATLLLPFWDTNPQVPQIITQMLSSNDRRMKYNTAILLLRNKRPLADSLLAEIADRVAIMYKGEIVEQGSMETIFKNASHTYTKALIACRPALHPKGEKLPTVSDYLERTNETELELGSRNPILQPVQVFRF